jgi:hypothetical protein
MSLALFLPVLVVVAQVLLPIVLPVVIEALPHVIDGLSSAVAA